MVEHDASKRRCQRMEGTDRTLFKLNSRATTRHCGYVILKRERKLNRKTQMEVPDRRTNARMRRTKQARTSSYPSVGGAIVWNETFEFKVVTGKEELRFHVCNSKSKDRSYYSRIAACGLYLKDILNARLPLRNRFQMFSIKKGLEVGNLGLYLSWKEAEPSLKREGE